MTGNGERRITRGAAAAGLAATVLLATALGGADASSGRDASDAEGPLDLARGELSQQKRKLTIRIATYDTAPPMSKLSRFPSRVGSDGERYLCLAVRGYRMGRQVLCPGGEVTRGRVTVGRSRYDDDGDTTRNGTLRARIRRPDARTITLSFRFADAGLRAGRIRWALFSGWSGPECLLAVTDPRCRDRLPDVGAVTARILRLRRVGCTRDEDALNKHGPRRKRRVALTFDDGPSGYTGKVLRILNRYRAKGTFFVVGDQIPGRTRVLRRALRRGHELANHSMHHSRLPSRSDIRRTSRKIKVTTGFRPCLFRPPYGALSPSVVHGARAAGASTILWDVDTGDWTTPGSGAIYRRAVHAQSGSIVLMHDGGGPRGQTVSALPAILRNLRSRGYRMVTVTKLLGERFRWREVG